MGDIARATVEEERCASAKRLHAERGKTVPRTEKELLLYAARFLITSASKAAHGISRLEPLFTHQVGETVPSKKSKLTMHYANISGRFLSFGFLVTC